MKKYSIIGIIIFLIGTYIYFDTQSVEIDETMYGESDLKEGFNELEFEIKQPTYFPEEIKIRGINIITHDEEQVIAHVHGSSSNGKGFDYYASKVELSHSENFDWEEIKLEDKNALISRRENETTIKWEDDGLTYELNSGATLDEESLIVIAESFE
ncbi:DUF4367 domain-containing protein [Evansella sp. AB-rgal1]|uniref:DUF4367 domain-containing protein n=1 Tax=Evansella sp. AB-rgal1 TaxID=3242696 RepID=UPI00359E66B6